MASAKAAARGSRNSGSSKETSDTAVRDGREDDQGGEWSKTG